MSELTKQRCDEIADTSGWQSVRELAEQAKACVDLRSENEQLRALLRDTQHCLQYYGERENWTPSVYRYEEADAGPVAWQDQYSYGWQGSGSIAPWDWPQQQAERIDAILNGEQGDG